MPLSIYDITGIESWLADQANSGLFPVFLNSWAAFTPTGVPGTRFRLAVKDGKRNGPSLEQLMLFKEAGWHYAFPVANTYFLFYTDDPAAADVYSDWESRRSSLELLKKRLLSCIRRTLAICAILAAVLIWILFFSESRYDLQPDPSARLALILLNLFQPKALLFFASVIWLAHQALRDYRLLCRICRALAQGAAPPPSRGPSKFIVVDQLIMAALIVSLGFSLIISCFGVLNPWSKIPLEHFSQPYISIQAMEQEQVLPWEDLFEEEPFGEKPENYAQNNFSLLAPVWYSVTQKAYSPQRGSMPNYFSPKPENGRERYAPGLDGTYFHLLIPALARSVAEAQLDYYRLVNLEWSYRELSFPGLDFAIHASEPDRVWQMLAIGKGGHVTVFRYAGREQLSDHLDVLCEAVK